MKKAKSVAKYLFYPVAGAGAFLAGQYLVLFPLAFLIKYVFGIDAKTFLSEPVPYAIVCVVCYLVSILILWLIDKRPREWKVLGIEGLPTWTDIGLGVAGFLVSFLGGLAVVYILTLIPGFDPNEAQDVGFDTMVGGAGRVFAFLALVVFGPVAEEVLFRGWVYGHLRGLVAQKGRKRVQGAEKLEKGVKGRGVRIGVNLVWSIILCSLAFAIMHGQVNVAANVFVMSVVCCLLREFTGTIYAGIVLHMIKNWLAFMVIFVFHLT